MTIEVPTNEPFEAIIGTTWEWTRSFDDFPASTWTLTYTFINGSNKIQITASADGDNYSVDVQPATTSSYTAGEYHWQAFVTDGTDTYKVDSGRLKVVDSYAANATLDDRTHVKKVLDAIESVIENRATLDQQSYSIAGRSLSLTPLSDLILLRDRYKSEYEKLLRQEKIDNGLGHSGTIRIRF